MQIIAKDISRGWSLSKYNAQTGDTILFYLKNADKIKTIKWDFGDGTFSNEEMPKHVFIQQSTAVPATGEFKVRVKVNGKKISKKILIVPRILCEFQAEKLNINENTEIIDFNVVIMCEAPYAPGDGIFETVCQEPSIIPPLDKFGVYTIKSKCIVRSEDNLYKGAKYPPMIKEFQVCPDINDLSLSSTINDGSVTFLVQGLSQHLLPTGSIIEWLIDGVQVKMGEIKLTHVFTEPKNYEVKVNIVMPGCYNHTISTDFLHTT
jgi:hypothetical protein